jgi:pimeloyl-ACP methyl ester carboxylesterase
MSRVMSPDGTSIAYERTGSGPPVVLIGGGLDDGTENEPLAAALAQSFTVLNYARRGRGESGDVTPYAVEREFEDLAALVGEAGAPARVFGVSSGGALALEAAAAGVPMDRVAVYEVPYGMSGWGEYVAELEELLAAGRRGDAVAHFMRVAGSSEDMIAAARGAPVWPQLEALAHTLAYDAACLGDGRAPAGRLATIGQPALVLTGGGDAFFERAGDAIADALPHVERRVLTGQGHVADPQALAPVLGEFFR